MKWENKVRNETDTGRLKPELKKNENPETIYSCPMGCEGDKTYSHSGNCPVYNMKLMPVQLQS